MQIKAIKMEYYKLNKIQQVKKVKQKKWTKNGGKGK